MTSNPYTLALSESEIRRYRKMAEEAVSQEREAIAAAGFVPGAHVADVGCGPGLFLTELARLVGPTGSVIGVEANAEARAAARATLAAEGLTNATIVEGDAGATGLEPGSLDAIMMRHVLVHNGARVDAIVAHLATRLKPGGHLYLLEFDANGVRRVPEDEDMRDIFERWFELMRRQGNDLEIGPKLGLLVARAGLALVDRDARYNIVTPEADIRPAPWAAREAMRASGLANESDFARWERAFDRVASAARQVAFIPLFRAVGRKLAA